MNPRLKDWRVILGALLVITGLDLLIMMSKLPAYVGFFFLLPGALILLYVFKDDIKTLSKDDKYGLEKEKYVPIIGKMTMDGMLAKGFPAAGILAILLDLWLNQGKEIGSFDTVILLWGALMIAYPFIPNKLYKERDFMLLFLSLILFILVLPAVAIGSRTEGGDYAQSPIVYYLLAKPMLFLLKGVGIDAFIENQNVIWYEVQEVFENSTFIDGIYYNAVEIATSCAGIYSLSIFISAFAAFVFIEYNRFDRYVGGFLALGVLLAWVANILRMTIIVMVGSYYGREALLWTHKYLGEIIFIAWTAVFWMLLFRYMPEPEADGGGGEGGEGGEDAEDEEPQFAEDGA